MRHETIDDLLNDPQVPKAEKIMLSVIKEWYSDFGPNIVERTLMMWLNAMKMADNEEKKRKNSS